MTLDVRPAEVDELRQVADVMRAALLSPRTDDEEWEKWKPGWLADHLAIGAWDGDLCVGHAGSFEFDTLVPGGTWLPTSGLTRVGVLPTHTRRGLLSQMIRRLLDDHRAAGRPIASLRASEAVIYGRFGFGLAGEGCSIAVQPRRVRPIRGAAPGTMRLLTAEEARTVVPDIYSRADHRPGALTRIPFMWHRILMDLSETKKATHVAVHTSPDGVDDGYVFYDVQWEEHDLAERLGTGWLRDLFGASPAVELALWDYLVNVSLLRTIFAENRPVDEVVRHAMHDVRGYEVRQRWDEQWIRLLDVERCLAVRSFNDAPAVTIAVDDPWYDDNCATFRVSAEGVQRVDTAPDLTAPIDAVSAAYMGAVPWRDLLAVGRVGGDIASAARADALFAHYPTTWSGTFF